VNGVHDMGGMHGLGPIVAETDEPVFHHPWEARVHALTLASPTRGNIDAGRHQRELIPGPEYLAMTYYEKWFRSLSELVLAAGLVTPGELADGHAAPGAARGEPRLKVEAVAEAMTRPASYVREAAAQPAFQVGDAVRGRNLNPTGHTRLPRYVRGRLRPRLPGLQFGGQGRGPAPPLHRQVRRPRALGAGRQPARHRLPRPLGALS
jgi:nitrile hydratase subunit beta